MSLLPSLRLRRGQCGALPEPQCCCAVTGRRIRRLRNRLGMTQEGFAKAYGIPLANIRQYEIGRTMPPLAVGAYLKVIDLEPEVVARAVGLVG
jgi:DNA-binding transcriptional regulator YiaG